MDVTEYEYDYTEQAQLLGLREKYTKKWADAFMKKDWDKMQYYDRVLVKIEAELETL